MNPGDIMVLAIIAAAVAGVKIRPPGSVSGGLILLCSYSIWEAIVIPLFFQSPFK